MKYWDFEDWIIFGIAVFTILCLLAVIVPLMVWSAKELWTLVLS